MRASRDVVLKILGPFRSDAARTVDSVSLGKEFSSLPRLVLVETFSDKLSNGFVVVLFAY